MTSKKESDRIYTIYVRNLYGKAITLNVPSSSTVLDLKLSICKSEGIPCYFQKLIFAGSILGDANELSYYNLGHENTINLIVLRDKSIQLVLGKRSLAFEW